MYKKIKQIIELKRSDINKNRLQRHKTQYETEDKGKRLQKSLLEVRMIRYNMTKDIGLSNDCHRVYLYTHFHLQFTPEVDRQLSLQIEHIINA